MTVMITMSLQLDLTYDTFLVATLRNKGSEPLEYVIDSLVVNQPVSIWNTS